MARIGGLGKGMAALLQVTETVDESKNYFVCPIEKIRPNRNQPRKHFAPEKLEELAASIREKGLSSQLSSPELMMVMRLLPVNAAGGQHKKRGCTKFRSLSARRRRMPLWSWR